MTPRPRYADDRPHVIAESLADLAGPRHGVVELPTALDWSPHGIYDVDNDADARLLYETVLREAIGLDDLHRFLNGELLVCLWPRLWLPRRLSHAWESRFPSALRSAA
jgi:hypothetical protein